MEIAEIKHKLPILSVLGHYGLYPDRNHRIHCPFHEDKTPSMQVYPETNTVFCFSTNCRLSGKAIDQIDFIMHKEGCTKHEAILKSQRLPGLNETPAGKTIPPGKGLPDPPPPKQAQDHTEILTKIFHYFRNGFTGRKDNKGRVYLERRGLDVEKLESLGITIGYNSAQFHHRGRISPQEMQACERAGLLVKSSNGSKSPTSYTPWAGYCVIFPLVNANGLITGLYGRSTLDSNKSRHFYLKNSKGLFYRPRAETRRLLITESIIDFLSLYQIDEIRTEYGFLPIYGTNRLNAEHREAVSQLKELDEIIFFLDGDKAGEEAVKKYGEELQQTYPNLRISKVETPEGEDINSLLVAHTEEVFTHLLDKRKKEAPLNLPQGETSGRDAPEKTSPSEEAPSRLSPNGKEVPLDTGNPYKITYATGTAIYHIKGGLGNALDNMKVTLEVEATESVGYKRKSRLRLDLYEDRQTEKAAREAGEKLHIRAGLIETDLGRLTDLLDEYRERQLEISNEQLIKEKPTIPIKEEQRCISFLKQKGLVKKINEAIARCGITGEENNRIFLFVIATAYKMPDTLHALIQGSSGSGKTYLSRQITDLMPREDVIRLTRVTESSFYNYGEYELQHKLIVLEDVDGLKEEAEFAFRELQSNGEITSSTSTKDENSGNIRAEIKRVKGPIGSIATTTRGEIYEDNMSRIFLLSVDEGKEQTRRIIEYQNQKAAGVINQGEEQSTKTFLQNCIRQLKPCEVINPYAEKILLPQEAHKIRRLTELFHAFIKQVTLINQYQRRRDKQGRLITEKEDIQTAIEIMFDSIILKIDELDGSLRQFYEELKACLMKQGGEYENYQFTQREIRQVLNIKKTRLSYYIKELSELEYIIRSGGYANRGFTYKITCWDNLQALRSRIKQYLNDQVEKI
jgi:DNA primase